VSLGEAAGLANEAANLGPLGGGSGGFMRFPSMGVPQNGWFILEKLVEMDDLGGPLF